MEVSGNKKPILFSGAMVRAILEGRKTQTRRVVKKLSSEWLAPGMFTPEFVANPDNNLCPYGNPGDTLWVRETFQYVDFAGEDNGYVYRATDPDWETMEGWRWKPSIFMPYKACRIFLKIEDVRIERLQDITEQDAIQEGVERLPGHEGLLAYQSYLTTPERQQMPCFPYISFKTLWHKINGRKSWDENPWVWVITFSRIE